MTDTQSPTTTKAATAAGASDARRRGPPRPRSCCVIAGAQMMVVLDGTIVNIALPSMGRYFDKSQTDMTWALNAYTLAFGGLLLLGGRMGDILGRRRMFIVGLGLFTLGSFLAGIAAELPAAARRTGDPGHRRRHRITHRTLADHHRVRGGRGADEGDRRLRGRVRRRRRARSAARRHPHQLPQLALGAVRQRADRPRADGRRVPLPAPVRAAQGPVRRRRRAAVGRRHGRDGLRLHPCRAQRLVRTPRPTWCSPRRSSCSRRFVYYEAKVAPEPMMPMRIFENRNRSGAYLVMFVVGAAMFGMFYFVTFFVQGVRDFSALKTGVSFLPGRVRDRHRLAGRRRRLLGRSGPKPLIITRHDPAHRRAALVLAGRRRLQLRGHAAARHDRAGGRHGLPVRAADRRRPCRRCATPTPAWRPRCSTSASRSAVRSGCRS